METTKQKLASSFKTLAPKFGYKNALAAPKLVKVVISSGTGSKMKNDKNKNTSRSHHWPEAVSSSV